VHDYVRFYSLESYGYRGLLKVRKIVSRKGSRMSQG
jgi:hypothetical protein